jgi:Ni,Fe-hydrogenase maturation factor
MDKVKILCLGNEFIVEDSLAKKIARELEKELDGFEFININDSFQLIEYLKEEIIILDVVEGLKEVKVIKIDDLESGSIMNAHDFDAGFFLKLIGDNEKVKIIGIPMVAKNEKEIIGKVKEMLVR